MKLRSIFRRKAAIIALLSGALLAGLFLAIPNPVPGDVEWLSTPPPTPNARLSFLGRWMWPVKSQLLRFKQKFTKPPALVTVSSTVMEFDPAQLAADWPRQLRAFTNEHGASAFILGNGDDAELLRNRLMLSRAVRTITRPQITVMSGQQGQIATTETLLFGPPTNARTANVGLWFDACPRIRADSVDLTCYITITDRPAKTVPQVTVASQSAPFLRTNVAFGARLQIPPGQSAFLCSGTTNEDGKVIGIIVQPRIWTPAKK